MRSIVLAVVLALLGSAAHSQPIGVDLATVSMSAPGVPRTVTNTICATDGNDLVCDRGAYLLPSGLISTTNISVTNISATRISGDGSQLTNLPSASASPTNVPAFLARRNAAQSIPEATNTKIVFDSEDFDTYNNFASGRFTPTIAGKYILSGMGAIDGNVDIFVLIYKNGSPYAFGNRTNASGNSFHYSTVSIVADANGTTDYFELYMYQRQSSPGAANTVPDGNRNYFSGSLLASGNGLISGSTALGDRITSGTTAVLANGTGYVSLSTASSTWGYLGSTDSYLPKITTAQVSASTISTTAVQIFSPTTALACSSSTAGTIRYNSPTTTLELCTGSGWQPMGVGIPAGTISAFASTTCPTGWSEYTAARGRFLRGIDNGAGIDADGTRAPGTAQADDFKSHSHTVASWLDAGSVSSGQKPANAGAFGNVFTGGDGNIIYSPANTEWPLQATGGGETRPKNVAVTFCQFNGTSNGWNNPLSGGSTSAAGSTGQLQYNTSGVFDASAGLTWTNASSLLTVNGKISATNISVTALTVNGINITGSGGTPAGPNRSIQFNDNGALGGIPWAMVDSWGNIITSGTGIYAGGNYGWGYVALNPSGNTTNSGYIAFHAPDNARAGYLGYADASWLHLNTENGRNLRILPDGGMAYISGTLAVASRVGIGLTNPADSLDVKGGIVSRGPMNGIGVRDRSDDTQGSILYRQSNKTRLWDGVNGDQMVLDNTTGGLGVGTLSPAARLDVNGEVRVGSTSLTCAAGTAGAIQYTGGSLQYCNGTSYVALAGTGALGNYVAKAGDTMTGGLGTTGLYVGTGGDYAGAEIRSYQTGFPYIDFSLNNSEDFRVRQYVDRGDGGLRFQGADGNVNFTIHQNGVLAGRNTLYLGAATFQADGNIYMPWLGGGAWLSAYLNQDVRNGANPTFGTVYTNNWFRSSGDTGWFSETYGGGWHMTDTTWLRAYNNKWIYTGGNIQADNQVRTANLCDTAGDNCSTPAAIAAAAGAATNKVSKAGDTMSGNLIVNAQVGIGTSNPQFPLDVSATSSYAIRAVTSGNAHGIYGQSLNAGQGGVIGYAANGTNFGILGHANAYSFYGNGQVYAGVTNSNPAVYGYNANNGYGVHGLSVSGIGVYGKSTNNYGVFGESATTYGVYGKSTNSAYGGILGYNYNGSVYGIVGYSGIYSFYGNGQGYFGSNLQAYAFTFTNPNQYSTSLCSYYDGSINYIGNCASLRKYKSNITDLTSGLSTVMKLRPREFDWKKGHGYGHDLGFVAEEMVEDYPLAAEYKGGTGELLGVKYEKLTALLTKAVQELKVENDNLRATVDQQKAANDNLSRSVESLTQRLERLEAAGR